MRRLRPVVAGKDDQRVVFDAQFLDGIQNLPDPVVHFGEAVSPVAVACPAANAGLGRVGRCISENET